MTAMGTVATPKRWTFTLCHICLRLTVFWKSCDWRGTLGGAKAIKAKSKAELLKCVAFFSKETFQITLIMHREALTVGLGWG
eukprot:CAMPEP_0174384576 /NCGR_PEP_ID=MMETSP0811_2-20130205/126016_1 /TAXON_ID=73025 ORGANISM="Eutreptiella gymnastica-like, Strain CCMP1594" /NCGR_SAMPLE_ID=MMETSP0811_2 /ASSEMBLY_ACC=CAM_ASM_000667 /LENGTH=81 /DNA_ID=CAMNT_0015538585 /DNA_START=795 /DNA_END=1037 /DNA_ORIENTATION=+